MYDLKLKVNANGKISYKGAIKLGTEGEFGSTRLVFDVDESVEGTYRYVKFVHDEASYLEKIKFDNTIIVPDSIYSYKGRWFISFISSKGLIDDDVITGDYAFITEPHEAYVVDGILDINILSKEEKTLVGLIEGTLQVLDFPTETKKIGPYFLAQCKYAPKIKIGAGIKSINTHAFEDGVFHSIEFSNDTNLESIDDYAFQRSSFSENANITIPNTVKSWGRNVFGSATLSSLTFEDGSGLIEFPTYAFYNIKGIKELAIPNGVRSLSGNGQTISSCSELEKIVLPNSFDTPIQEHHIQQNDILANIELGMNWNVSVNFSKCKNLTKESMIAMFKALKDRSSNDSLNITLGETNLAKLDDGDIQIAVSKNWTVS